VGSRFAAAVVAAGVAIFAQAYALQGILPVIAGELGVTASTAALAISATTLGVAASAIPWALLSERFGRTRIMRVCFLAATVLGIVSAFAPTFELLVLARGLTGIALGGLPALVVSYITEHAGSRLAVRMVGLYIAGTTLGGLSGRVVSSIAAEAWGWQAGVVSVGVLSAVCALVFLLGAPAAPAPLATGSAPRARASLRDIWKPRLLALYAQAALLMGAFISVFNYLGFHVVAPPFDVPPSLVFAFFLAYIIAWPAAPLTGAIVARLGDRAALMIAQGGMLVGMALLALDSLGTLIAGVIMVALSFFSAHATASRMTAEAGGASRALASAAYVICYYAGASLFGWLSGFVFEGPGWRAMILAVAGLVSVAFLVTAVGPRPARAG